MSKDKKDLKVKELIELVQSTDLPQIILDSFENNFTKKFFPLNLKNELIIEKAMQCYEKYNKLIERLPNEVATAFIYDYCTTKEEDIIVKSYSYYKGYRDIFYLLHEPLMSSVFIIYNGVSLQKDRTKYNSDFSWGALYINSKEKRVSANTHQTAEVILQSIFPNDDNKLNLLQIFIDDFLVNHTVYDSNSSFSKQDVLDWYNTFNLIKRVCLEQKLTYREFGEKVGFGEGAIKNAAASGKISDQLKRATEMYLEIQELKKENIKFKKLQNLMKEIITI